jgi:hypothetical protein
MATITTLNESTRCTHRTANGRRCQAPFAPNHTALCAQHALQELQLHDSKIVTEEILGPLGDFRSAFAVNRALGKLFTITAENRIPVRNALALAYIGQLLLQSLRPLRSEAIETGGKMRMDAIINDAVLRLSNELPSVPNFSRNEMPKPPLREQVEESLEILKNAGFNLPAALVPQPRDEDDGNEADDDSEDSGSDENEIIEGGRTYDSNGRIRQNASRN